MIEIAAPTKSTNGRRSTVVPSTTWWPAKSQNATREPGQERHAEHRRRHRREVVRPRQVGAVELRADRERERDEADRAQVAHDAHRVLGEQPRRQVVRPEPSTVGPISTPASSCPITAGWPRRRPATPPRWATAKTIATETSVPSTA